jgi:hypothetical protein
MQFKWYGYSINPSGEKFVFTREAVDELFETTWVPIYEFFGTFKQDRMEATNTIVVKWGKVLLDRAKFLADSYGISYNNVDTYDEITYVRYIFKTSIKKTALPKLYANVIQAFWVPIEIGLWVPDTKNTSMDFTFCMPWVFSSVCNKVASDGGAGSLNYVKVVEVNRLDIEEVATKLRLKRPNIDHVLNIETSMWNVFSMVTTHYGSTELAMDFFNTEYDIEFRTKLGKWDVLVSDWDSLNQIDGCYYKVDDEGQMKKITDFVVHLKSIYISHAGERQYNVTLENMHWVESQEIPWENSSNKNKVADYVQRFGSYHFFGANADVLKIHTLLSSMKAPTITTVVWYGWHDDICVFANGIWDSKRKEFFQSEPNDQWILFKDNWDWIIVTDNLGNRLDKMLANKTSLLKVPQTKTDKAKFLSTVKWFWKDDTGMVLFMIACSVLGSGTMHLRKDTPLYYFRWITQSGKTTMSEILQRMLGYPLNAAETFEWTLFTAIMLLTSNYNLPVFFTEGRQKSRQMEDKVSMFRSAYDKMVIPRGRADMTSVQFPLTAIAIMEWEEMLKDWATRTRCIQFRPSLTAKISQDEFLEKIKQVGMFDYFMHSYLSEVNPAKYEKYLMDWLKIFAWVASGRNTHNIAHMYASVMCYYPEVEEDIMPTLAKLLAFQAQDEKDNGTSVDIVKAISAFIQKREYPIYFMKDWFVISWESIQEYSRKYKQELSLSVSSYREHLDALGYTIDFYEVQEMWLGGDMLVEWAKFPFKDVDKRLLCNKDIYEQYKLYQQRVI